MFRKKAFSKERERKDPIHWRGHEILRVEAFSDAVFAFAVTLLIVSLEVPHSFHEMFRGMMGFFPFAACFLIVFQIWSAQNLFFRRFGLHDEPTLALNGILLFVVLFFVYPLKFLFMRIMSLEDARDLIGNWKYLFYIYNSGFFTIYLLFCLMYVNALRKSDLLKLTEKEMFQTRTYIIRYLAMAGIAVVSSFIASFGDRYAFYAGISYALIGPVVAFTHKRRAKIHFRRFGEKEGELQGVETAVLRE